MRKRRELEIEGRPEKDKELDFERAKKPLLPK